MTQRTQAEVFIQTLREMCEHEREQKNIRRRRELKALVRQFVLEIRSDFDGHREALQINPRAIRPGHEAGERALGGRPRTLTLPPRLNGFQE